MLFDVAGQQVEAAVTSIRRVDWDTMRVNFFAILTPAALADMPQSWITSFYLPPGKEPVLPALVREFPNLTVFDVGAILRQLQSVLNEVGRAVQLLFLFTLAAGVLVLAAALTATRDERMREAAVLRALGATRRQLARSQRIELWAVGGLAGLLAAAGASAIAWVLSTLVFDFAITLSLWPWLAGIGAGMLGAWGGGAWPCAACCAPRPGHPERNLMTSRVHSISEPVDTTRSIFDLLGGEPGVRALVDRFYDLMDIEPDLKELRAAHGPSLDEARDKLFWFLCGYFGGPDHYIERFGHPRLRARHLPFPSARSSAISG